MRTAGIAIAGILSLATGCGGPCECDVAGARSGTGTGTGTGTDTGSDEGVEAGAGWTRMSPGTWQFAVDGGRDVESSLPLPVGSRTQLTIPLPTGARGARLSKVTVTHTEPGAGAWTVHTATPDGLPATQLASMAATVHGGSWNDVAFDPPPEVTDRFVLVFEATDGPPALGVLNAPLAEAKFAQQLGVDQMLAPVAQTPFLRVVLTNVH